MKFEIFCTRCARMEKVKTLSMDTWGRMEIQLSCGHWVYLKMMRYTHCGYRLKVSEKETLYEMLEEKIP